MFTFNPLLLYVLIICLSDVIVVDFFHFSSSLPYKMFITGCFIYSCIILLMYMMSTANMTFSCHSSRSVGRSSNAFISTFDSVFLSFFLLLTQIRSYYFFCARYIFIFDGTVGKHFAFPVSNKIFSSWLSYNVLYGPGF